MSVHIGGQYIHCDGEKCEAIAHLPVALRSTLGRSPRVSDAAGWLFKQCGNLTLHFCPKCAFKYIDCPLTESETGSRECCCKDSSIQSDSND